MFKIFSLSLLDVTVYDVLILILFMLALLLTIIFCLILVSTQIRHLIYTSKENHNILLASNITKSNISDIKNANEEYKQKQEQITIFNQDTVQNNSAKNNVNTETMPLLLENHSLNNTTSDAIIIDKQQEVSPVFPMLDSKIWDASENKIASFFAQKNTSSTETHENELTLLPALYEEPQNQKQEIIIKDQVNPNNSIEDTLKVIAASLQNISNIINDNASYKNRIAENVHNVSSENLNALDTMNYQDFQNPEEIVEEYNDYENQEEENIQNIFLNNDFGISPPSYIQLDKSFTPVENINNVPENKVDTKNEQLIDDTKKTSNDFADIPSMYTKYDVSNIDELADKYSNTRLANEIKISSSSKQNDISSETFQNFQISDNSENLNNHKINDDRYSNNLPKPDKTYIRKTKFDNSKIRASYDNSSSYSQRKSTRNANTLGTISSSSANSRLKEHTFSKYSKSDSRNMQANKYSKFRKYDVKHNELDYRVNKNIFSNLQNQDTNIENSNILKQYRTSTSRLRRNTR